MGTPLGNGVAVVPATHYYAPPSDPYAPRAVPRTGMECIDHPEFLELGPLHPEMAIEYEHGHAFPPVMAEHLVLNSGSVYPSGGLGQPGSARYGLPALYA